MATSVETREETTFDVVVGSASVLLGWCLASVVFWLYLNRGATVYPAGSTVPFHPYPILVVIPIVGMFQPIVSVPAYFWMRRRGRRLISKGILRTGLLLSVISTIAVAALVYIFWGLASLR